MLHVVLKKKRIIIIGALAYMHIFVVMFEMYMLCVSSDFSHHVYYILYYTMLGFLALLEFEINYNYLSCSAAKSDWVLDCKWKKLID